MHELKTSFKIGAGVTSKFYFRYLTKFPLAKKCKNASRKITFLWGKEVDEQSHYY